MNAHISSKLILRRIAGKNQPKRKEKIGYYDIKEKKFGTMKIDSKNKKLVIKNLHDKLTLPDNEFLKSAINLELERAKLEDNFAKVLDNLIELPLNSHLLLDENKYDLFLKFFIFQSFTTIDNFENNQNNVYQWLNKKYENIKKETELDFSEFLEKIQPLLTKDLGIEEVNYKLIELIENKGIYFDKVQILKKDFIPIILNLENHKAFYTDKLLRIYGSNGNHLLECGLLPEEAQKYKNTEFIENFGFSCVFLQIGPIDNNNLLIFVNKSDLEKWDLKQNITQLSKIRNKELEKWLFEEKNFFSITNQKPIQYIWFNNEDLVWIKNYFLKMELM